MRLPVREALAFTTLHGEYFLRSDLPCDERASAERVTCVTSSYYRCYARLRSI